ncbi:DUF6773 family protein [Bacillus wiedmannii]|uniref:DUF6773 family protein n=1 Tax=Bacillus wiedmannii TaxID=1890302 RepID=UPI003CF6EFCE
MRKLFSINSYDDERLSALEYKAYAEVGCIIFGLVCIDLLVRAIILDRPLLEWVSSFVIYIFFISYMIYRHNIMGIKEKEILNPSQLQDYKLMERISNGTTIIYILFYFISYGKPHTQNEWFKLIYITGMIAILSFLISKFLICRIKNKSYRNNY